MINVIIPFILGAFQKKEVKELVISLLEKYVKTTDNKVDDALVAAVRKALLPQ